jgi:hypothetical protein
MADEIVEPFLLKYEGGDADRHIVEADTFGLSIVGGARYYTAVAHYCFFGFVPYGHYKRSFACYARSARPASVEQWLFIAPIIAGEFALHQAMYRAGISYIFRKVCDGVLKLWTTPKEIQAVVERLAAALEEQARVNADVQTQLAMGLVRSNDNLASLHAKLIETLPALAAATRSHGVRLVAPVGRTCKEIVQFADTPSESRITEADAEVIRGGGDMEVDSVADYQVNRIREINLKTGHCIVEVEGIGEVRGKITDPSLEQPSNVYTSALDKHVGCSVQAKAVRKDGEIHRLFISDAKPIEAP